jgi:hypothetical protein
MNVRKFSFRNEAELLTLISYGIPAVGIVAGLLLWLFGYFE